MHTGSGEKQRWSEVAAGGGVAVRRGARGTKACKKAALATMFGPGRHGPPPGFKPRNLLLQGSRRQAWTGANLFYRRHPRWGEGALQAPRLLSTGEAATTPNATTHLGAMRRAGAPCDRRRAACSDEERQNQTREALTFTADGSCWCLTGQSRCRCVGRVDREGRPPARRQDRQGRVTSTSHPPQ